MKSRKTTFRKPLIAAAAVALVAALSVTAYAVVASRLSPSEVADHLGQTALAEAFRGDDSLLINETVKSHGYEITLHGLAIGNNLSEYASEVDIDKESTYIVYSIAKENGTPMNYFEDDSANFMQTVFFQGYRPWLFSSWTLGMGASGFEHDGVFYKLFKIGENIEWLANREITFGVWETSQFGFAPGSELVQIDDDGRISLNDGFEVANAMFTLPLDPAKADMDALVQFLAGMGHDDQLLEWADVNNCLDSFDW